MTTHEILTKARKGYARCPSHAPRGTFPRDGVCLVMAIDNAADIVSNERREAMVAVATAAGISNYRGYLIEWNANATTEEVLAAFDRAIEATAA